MCGLLAVIIVGLEQNNRWQNLFYILGVDNEIDISFHYSLKSVMQTGQLVFKADRAVSALSTSCMMECHVNGLGFQPPSLSLVWQRGSGAHGRLHHPEHCAGEDALWRCGGHFPNCQNAANTKACHGADWGNTNTLIQIFNQKQIIKYSNIWLVKCITQVITHLPTMYCNTHNPMQGTSPSRK